MFDETLYGFFATGDALYFRPLVGNPVQVCNLPPDVDSHSYASALNSACNAVSTIVRSFSNFRF